MTQPPEGSGIPAPDAPGNDQSGGGVAWPRRVGDVSPVEAFSPGFGVVGPPLAPEPLPPPPPPEWAPRTEPDNFRMEPESADAPRPTGDAPPPPLPRSLVPPGQLPYPVRYEVEYPDRLSRWKTLIRLPLLYPVYLFLYLVQLALMPLFLIGFTTVFWKKKYPSWAFAGGAGAMAYVARATAYGLLQTDRFPSFDYEHSDVVLEFAQPPSGYLSRWRVFWWKLTLLFPHYIVLYALQLALVVVTTLAWLGILFTGNYPRGMFAFATGVMRWHYRVLAYLVSYNDRYPPFALSREAGPAANKTVVWSGVIGALVFGGLTMAVIAAAVAGNAGDTQTVRYEDLRNGNPAETIILDHSAGGSVHVRLTRVTDPGGDLIELLTPASDGKVVVFEWTIRNRTDGERLIPGTAVSYTYSDGRTRRAGAQLVTVDGRVAPDVIDEGTSAVVQAVFVVPKTAVPLQLHFETRWTTLGGITYKFSE